MEDSGSAEWESIDYHIVPNEQMWSRCSEDQKHIEPNICKDMLNALWMHQNCAIELKFKKHFKQTNQPNKSASTILSEFFLVLFYCLKQSQKCVEFGGIFQSFQLSNSFGNGHSFIRLSATSHTLRSILNALDSKWFPLFRSTLNTAMQSSILKKKRLCGGPSQKYEESQEILEK